MRWWTGCILLLFCVGESVKGELFNFDVSSLRPDELCALTAIWRKQRFPNEPFINLCPIQTHLKLSAGRDDRGDPTGTAKTTLIQNIAQIHNVSANRAVALSLQSDPSLLDAVILAPIGQQIVEFIIQHMAQSDLTSRLPAVGLTNLVDLRFWYCRDPGLQLHKADFSGMKNIRAIEFRGTPLESVEPGTFTDLPTLQTLALGNDLGDWDEGRVAVWRRLNCDAKNAWLWQFVKGKPELLKSRGIGKIFTLGNFTSTFLDVEEPRADCTGNATAVNT